MPNFGSQIVSPMFIFLEFLEFYISTQSMTHIFSYLSIRYEAYINLPFKESNAFGASVEKLNTLILSFCKILLQLLLIIIIIWQYLSTCPFLDGFLFSFVTMPMLCTFLCTAEIIHTSLHVKIAFIIIDSEHFQIF